MRAYIIADMVGACGIWRKKQCQVGTKEWREGRKQLTMDVNACIEGLQRLGYTEIMVKDIHGCGTNMKPKGLLPGVLYEPGIHLHPVPLLGQMRWANCAILLGFHARAGTEDAFFPHTLNEKIERISINDLVVGEAELVAALLGEIGVTVNCISGDQALIRQVKNTMPWLDTLVVPKDRQASIGLQDGGTALIRKRNELRAMVEKSCSPKRQAKKFSFSNPVKIAVRFTSADLAQIHNSWGFRQVDQEISWEASDFLTGFEQMLSLLMVPRQLKKMSNSLFLVTNFYNRLVHGAL